MALHAYKTHLFRSIILRGFHTGYRIALNRAHVLQPLRNGFVAAIAIWCISLASLCRDCLAQQLPPPPEPRALSLQSYEQPFLTPTNSLLSPPLSDPPISAAAAIYSTRRPYLQPRVVDRKFLLWNGLHLGLAVLDVELTQHCIASHQCREGNPLMPSSQAGQLSIGIGYVALGSASSYWLKKHKSAYWWIPPAGGIAGHTAGVVTGLTH